MCHSSEVGLEQLSRNAFRLGRVWGVEVKVHFLFVLVVAFMLLTSASTGAAAMSLVVLFGSVFLHELGHCAGARWVGGEASEIVLWPLGGFTRMRVPRTALAELVSTGMGPGTNLALAAAAGLGLWAVGVDMPLDRGLRVVVGAEGAELHRALLLQLAGVNVMLFLFNVIPAYPLDGGRLLRAMLWPAFGWRTATLLAGATAMVIGVAIGALGVLTSELVLVLMAAFVVYASFEEFRRAQAFRPLPPVPDDDLMPSERRG